MAEGDCKMAAFVDESASQEGYDGPPSIPSGAADGPSGLFMFMVSDIIGAEHEKVGIVCLGRRGSIANGRKIAGEIEMRDGLDADLPMPVMNSKNQMGRDMIAATGLTFRIPDHGRVWDFGGRSAEICAIDWSGPEP
jgi:hypothetical protein